MGLKEIRKIKHPEKSHKHGEQNHAKSVQSVWADKNPGNGERCHSNIPCMKIALARGETGISYRESS
jgi:hypothetical protein